jgi:hypothetical protein
VGISYLELIFHHDFNGRPIIVANRKYVKALLHPFKPFGEAEEQEKWWEILGVLLFEFDWFYTLITGTFLVCTVAVYGGVVQEFCTAAAASPGNFTLVSDVTNFSVLLPL